MKKGFTLVEMLVVIAMLMLLAGAVTSSVASAQKRAKIEAAKTVVQELTNAALAYENYGELKEIASWQPVTKSSIDFLLGQTSEDGRKVPVLFNASLKGERMVDPWGNPFEIRITKGTISGARAQRLKTGVWFPNVYRRLASED